MTCRVLLADDHRLVLEGLRALLDTQPNVEVVALARDGRDAVRRAREERPDIVILDVSMRGMNGADATRRIRFENPDTKIICLSVYSDSTHVATMLQAGATGYLLKEDAMDELVKAIRAVADGQSYLSPRVAASAVELIRDGQIQKEPSPFSLLTPREREVLQLLAEGSGSREIAERLHLSVRTVGSHRESLKRKLGIHSTAGLTRYAIRSGLTPLDV